MLFTNEKKLLNDIFKKYHSHVKCLGIVISVPNLDLIVFKTILLK